MITYWRIYSKQNIYLFNYLQSSTALVLVEDRLIILLTDLSDDAGQPRVAVVGVPHHDRVQGDLVLPVERQELLLQNSQVISHFDLQVKK